MLETGILLVVLAALALCVKLRAGKKTTDKRGGGSSGGRGGSGRRSNHLK